MSSPYIMTEDYWANSMLSVVRCTGRIKFREHEYIIVNKEGKDIYECSAEAEKAGREKAIEPGEPCDLCRQDLVPSYRKLGRDRIIELVKQGKTVDEIKEIAGVKKTKRKRREEE